MPKGVEGILKDLVAISSFGKIDENHPIIEYMSKGFGDCVENCILKDASGNVHLLIGINTPLSNISGCTVLSGHIDTVKPVNNLDCRVDENNGTISGCGTSDMKGFWASVIANKESLKQSQVPVVVAMTSDEETKLNGINVILDEMKNRNINPNLVIVGEPTASTFSLSNRGNAIFVNNFKGVPAHTSAPNEGENAILMASKMIDEIAKEEDRCGESAIFCITGIESKSEVGVVPHECLLKFGVRANNEQTLSEIVDNLQTATSQIGLEDNPSTLTKVFEIPPFESRASEKLFSVAKEHNIDFSNSQFTTEAGYFQKAFPTADVVIYGPGSPDKIHTQDEFIERGNLMEYSEKLTDIIEQNCQLNQDSSLEE